MAFVVETGAVVPGANALASVAAVDAYFADRGGNALWTGANNAAKEIGIVRATSYSERRFGRQYRGNRVSGTQPLSWPRSNAQANDGYVWAADAIPLVLVYAIAEYAARSLTRDLLDPAVVVDPTSPEGIVAAGGKITGWRSKVDVIEDEFTFSQAAGGDAGLLATSALASGSAFPAIPAGDLWIEELLRGTLLGRGSVQFGRVFRG